MKRRTVLAVLVAAVLVVLAAAPVMALPPLGVRIEVLTALPAGCDPFVATGPGVDSGFFCATGHVSTSPYNWPPPLGGHVTMVKYFVCDDGSGSFDVELRVKCDLSTGNTTGRWKVVGGTGSYAGLIGSGTLIGTYDASSNTVLDVYRGRMGIPSPPPMPPPWWVGGMYLVWRGGW